MAEKLDTIVAISTPAGRGGIGVVRLSGPDARHIAEKITGIVPRPRYAHHCRFLDRNQQLIDSGLAIFFPAPHSYTGEDVVELHAHGSRIILDILVKESITHGARLARPGEYTERAYLNGKIDLVQAEAVADLIDSVSTSAARSASRSLSGEFSSRLAGLLDEIIALRVQLEGMLDFPEEDAGIPPESNLSLQIGQCIENLGAILQIARQGSVLREGVDIVILGRPNVGKSTFLNRLAGRETAIVTDIPGTTRDMIREQILIDNIPVHVTDTAGLRETGNAVEQEGVRRARTAAESADLIVLLRVQGENDTGDEVSMLPESDVGKTLIIYNKIDLENVPSGVQQQEGRATEIRLSAKTGEGMELFAGWLKDQLGVSNLGEDLFMARTRHVAALEKAIEQLSRARSLAGDLHSPELVAEEMRLAQVSLGEITGEFVPDDLLGEIFARFCIGK